MAIKFEKITAGMTLYDVRKADWRSVMRGDKWRIWSVYVVGVDKSSRRVLASWNGNAAEFMSERRITKCRATLPKDKAP